MSDLTVPMPPAPEAEQKLFSFSDHAAIWFSFGVGLLVIQMGSFLVGGVGTKAAFIAIVNGSLIGAAILAYGARLGQETGQASASLMTATFGGGFAKLPILLNILQLLGWTAFELVIISDGTIALAERAFGQPIDSLVVRLICAAFWGGLLLLLLSQKMQNLARNIGSKYLTPLVVLSLIWLTYQFTARLDGDKLLAFWNAKGDGGMSILSAMDLVIAMPISWLPLVADFSRFGKRAKTAQTGTWVGYAVANIWCYGLGFLIASTGNVDAGMVAVILLAQGGLIALGVILIDELDNAYGDAYSGIVSVGTLIAEPQNRHIAPVFVVLCAAFAAFLPMHNLETFLLTLSSVFLPLFGVIFGVAAASRLDFSTNAPIVRVSYAAIWVAGIALFHAVKAFAPNLGASLPTLATVFIVTYCIAHQRRALADGSSA